MVKHHRDGDWIIFKAPEGAVEVKKGHQPTEVMHKGESEWRYYGLPFYPLSHNNAYGTARGGKRFIRREYEEYKMAIIDLLRMIDAEHNENKLYGEAYELRIAAVLNHGAMFFKNGNFRKFDVDGLIKLAQDAIFEYLHVDDSTLIDVRSQKIEVTPLPFEEKRYSENPTWDNKGGVVCIGIRTVPIKKVTRVQRDDDAQLSEMLTKCKRLSNYMEPNMNFRRGKKEQARRKDRDQKKTERTRKNRKGKGDQR